MKPWEADVVVAFVGLSPQLEGEDMPLKIEGFDGGDRTSLELPAPQRKLLEAVASTGKPIVVVLQSGSAVALKWAHEHAGAILEAWYPGVEGGSAIARAIAGDYNPAGRLPITFYASLDGLPSFTDYGMKNRTYRYFTGKPLWGFGYGLSYSTFAYGPVTLSAEKLAAGEPISASVMVTNTSSRAGDEVVEAYLKTPQVGGPIHSLVGLKRVHLAPGARKEVTITIAPRALSSVADSGRRMILAGKYRLTLAGAQPQDAASKGETEFTITGTMSLPE
jgi:beta-glucosidase